MSKTAASQPYPTLRPGDRGWERTLWAMAGIQFVMTASISFLSPIIPLMLLQLGVETGERIASRIPSSKTRS